MLLWFVMVLNYITVMQSLFFTGFLILLSLSFVPSSSALESLSLIITKAGPQEPAEESAVLDTPLVPRPGYILVMGRLEHPRLRLPTANHIGLYDEHGQPLQLWIDRSSLVFTGDRISALGLAFEIPEPMGPAPIFKLVWSEENTALARNLEVPGWSVPADARMGMKTFIVKPPLVAEAGDVVSTVIVEVDPGQRAYQVWYLVPILLILALAALRHFWLQDEITP